MWYGGPLATLLRLHHTKRLSVLACDITGNITVGDCTGRIHLWQGIAAVQTAKQTRTNLELNFRPRRCKPAQRHWHSRSVECLSFTTDGAYLLSGGSEAVLARGILKLDKDHIYLPWRPLCGISVPRCYTRRKLVLTTPQALDIHLVNDG